MKHVTVLLLALSLMATYVPVARADHGSDLLVLASPDKFAEAPIPNLAEVQIAQEKETSETENPAGESTANKVVFTIIVLGFIAAVIIATAGAGAGAVLPIGLM